MKDKSQISYSYDDKYEGYNNEEIKLLRKDLRVISDEQKRIEDEFENRIKEIKDKIEKIQDNCIHTYKLACRGTYEDDYSCSKCGHSIIFF
jgi:rubrerythrin